MKREDFVKIHCHALQADPLPKEEMDFVEGQVEGYTPRFLSETTPLCHLVFVAVYFDINLCIKIQTEYNSFVRCKTQRLEVDNNFIK